MKLQTLLKQAGLDISLPSESNQEISHISTHTDDVREGSLFLNLSHTPAYAATALQKGAAFILPGRMLGNTPQQTIAALANTLYRKQYGPNMPTHKALVTGTNGKTSVTWFLHQLCVALKKKSATYGTLGVIGANIEDAVNAQHTLTTPNIAYNYQALYQLGEAGIDYVCLEGSSHALDARQQRLCGLEFQVGAITNISQDHFDYHGDMAHYVAAKANIVDYLAKDAPLVVNVDDAHAQHFITRAQEANHTIISYGTHPSADIHIVSSSQTKTGMELTYRYQSTHYTTHISLKGEFQLHNIACVLGMGLGLGLQMDEMITVLPSLSPPPGRMELVGQHLGADIYVDYAHTPDALTAILRTARKLVQTPGQLVVVFGAGGDRDSKKRILMGKAAEMADRIIITSDNPRGEDPETICADIAKGVTTKHAIQIIDRKTAITHAIEQLQAADVLVIAGKGHEVGQEIQGAILPFDDTHIVQEALLHTLWNSMSLKEALKNTDHIPNNLHITGVHFNSQEIQPGDLFIALTTGVRDGHDFLDDAYAKGAVAALVSQPHDDPRSIIVPDTLEALEQLARHKRSRTKATVIGVTGSVGKTSAKQALYDVAVACGKQTHATQGNLNNHIGLPLTLARMPNHTELAIIEMGMNHAGEIATLSDIAQPNIAIITTITDAHFEHFASLEDIAHAKAEIFLGMREGGLAILPADSEYFSLLEKAANMQKILSFGQKPSADYQLLSYEEDTVHVKYAQYTHHYMLTGIKHDAINSLAVFAALEAAGLPSDAIVPAMAQITTPKGRGNIVTCKLENIEFTLINDSYNASPMAMHKALDQLHIYGGKRRVALLGDMLELGQIAHTAHQTLAQHLGAIDLLLTVGPLMQHLYHAAPNTLATQHFDDWQSAQETLPALLMQDDILLIKGSHGSGLWQIANQLETHALSPARPTR